MSHWEQTAPQHNDEGHWHTELILETRFPVSLAAILTLNRAARARDPPRAACLTGFDLPHTMSFAKPHSQAEEIDVNRKPPSVDALAPPNSVETPGVGTLASSVDNKGLSDPFSRRSHSDYTKTKTKQGQAIPP